MKYDIDDLIRTLPRVDAPPGTVARVRRQAHILLEGGRGARGHVRVELARMYNSLLEPVLLAGTAIVSLAWAISRILYITG